MLDSHEFTDPSSLILGFPCDWHVNMVLKLESLLLLFVYEASPYEFHARKEFSVPVKSDLSKIWPNVLLKYQFFKCPNCGSLKLHEKTKIMKTLVP